MAKTKAEAGIFFADLRRNGDLQRLPEPYRGWKLMSIEPETISGYNPGAGGNLRSSELNAEVLDGLIEYAKGENSRIGAVKVGGATIAAEEVLPDGQTLLCMANGNGRVFAALRSVNGEHYPIKLNGAHPNMAAVLLCILLSAEARGGDDVCFQMGEALAQIRDGYASNGILPEKEARFLCDALVNGLKYGILPCSIPGGTTMEKLTKDRILRQEMKGVLLCGKAPLLCPEETEGQIVRMTVAEAKERYANYTRTLFWTEEERMHIPVFEDDFPVPDTVIKMADRFVHSRGCRHPINNWALRGSTGIGKSFSVEILACVLDTPLFWHTCSTNTELSSFLCSFVPNPDCGKDAALLLPSLREMNEEPEKAYEKLTGMKVCGITSAEVFEVYTEKCRNTAQQLFRLVESDFIRALTRGYMIEIQEYSRIRDPGVLVGLNNFHLPGSVIPLVDGRHVRRHPNAITVWTDNLGYVSCRPVDPSFLRRMDYVIDSYDLEKTEILRRAEYNSGLHDTILLEKLYRIWYGILAYCRQEQITGGAVAVTELERLAEVIRMEGTPHLSEAVRECIVAKVSAEREMQEEVFNSCASLLIAKEGF